MLFSCNPDRKEGLRHNQRLELKDMDATWPLVGGNTPKGRKRGQNRRMPILQIPHSSCFGIFVEPQIPLV